MKKRKSNPIKTMTKEMLSMTAGGMVAGTGASALGAMGAPAAASGGLTAAAGMMPTMGAIVGAKGVIGMTGKMMEAMPKEMKPKKRRR